MDQTKFVELMSNVQTSVKKHGYTCLNVGNEYAYTIGLTKTTAGKRPDAIIWGLPHYVAVSVLATYAQDKEHDIIFDENGECEVDWVLEGYPAKLVKIDSEIANSMASVARIFNKKEDVQGEFIQIVWPNADGVFDAPTDAQLLLKQ